MLLLPLMLAWGLPTYADGLKNYFADGTRWTELRLDTSKHEAWYTEQSEGDRMAFHPNYERVDYYVQGDTLVDYGDGMTFRYVWQHVEGQPDSIKFVITYNEQENQLSVTRTFWDEYDGARHLSFHFPARLYDFTWQVGKRLDCEDIEGAACTCFPVNNYTLGTIREVKKATFGAERLLEYVDVDSVATYYGGMLKDTKPVGTKLIHGIGVSSWPSSVCLFGPACPQGTAMGESSSNAPFRSILVYFERDGEVLYDQWPTPDGGMAQHVQDVLTSGGQDDSAVYDLQGRKVEGKPSRGIYIIGGKKRVVE